MCLTCLQSCDAWGLAPDSPAPADLHPETGRVVREATRDYALVLVKHHGAEELRRYDMGSRNWDMQDVKQRMDKTQWFNPSQVGEGEEADKHRRARAVNDEDEQMREVIQIQRKVTG